MPPPRERGRALGRALGALAIVVIVVALALLLDIGPLGEDELSRSEFTAAADAICVDAHDEFLGLQREPPRTAREARELTERLSAIARDERDEIAGLDRPADLDPLVERYLEARDEGIEVLEAGGEAAADGDPTAYADRQAEVAGGQAARRQIARRLGLTECSRPLDG